MPLALSPEHRALAEVASQFGEAHHLREESRNALDTAAARPPDYWRALAELGFLGLDVPVALGGQGYTQLEVAVVVEQLAMYIAPAPLLSTLIAINTISRCGSEWQKSSYLPRLIDGSTIAAVATTEPIDGSARSTAIYGAFAADLLLVPHGTDDLAIVERQAPELTLTVPPADLDLMRRSMIATLVAEYVKDDQVLVGGRAQARIAGWRLGAAEASGGIRRCLDLATTYAKQRVQFGRTIGTFQATKHVLADLLAASELSVAAVWNSAQQGPGPGEVAAAAAAATVAIPAYVLAAKQNIQVHGGIGYTWEHEAHQHLRRATSLRAFLAAESAAAEVVVSDAERGHDWRCTIDLPPQAESYRSQARAAAQSVRALPPAERRRFLVSSGYLVPHWPKPWGRAADPVEQLVIDEEFGDIERADLGITGWIARTLVEHASPEQIARWIRPILLGEMAWCQLFSEPEAGSDAAAIRTRGTRVEGGWRVDGQKIWTSGAASANRGFATVRTDWDAGKHAGITTMAIDMQLPGVEVRPLRELTGGSLFNEVFLDGVFVRDDDVVGPIGGGWPIARATLGNERVSIGARRHDDRSPRLVLKLAARYAADVTWRREAALLLAQEYAMHGLRLRQAARSIAGSDPGPEGNVSKLLAGEHTQRTAELGMRVAAVAAVTGTEPEAAQLYLFSRCLTIAGGTSEIIRNQIAERLLGLPRDPLEHRSPKR